MSEPLARALADLTTMGVGGAPAEIVWAHSRDQLIEAARALWNQGEDWLILGGGSNLVVADQVQNLHVIAARNLGIERTATSDGELWRVQSGENWDELVAASVEAGLAGIEALSGIPGCVGAAPMQNIGAYGQEVAETITRVEFLDYESHEVVILENHEMGFAYRDSAFKRGRLGVITWVEFKLSKLGGLSKPNESTQVAAALSIKIGEQTELASIRSAVLKLRAAKGMIFDQADPDSVGCGSFFTNPIVSDTFARTLPSDAPRYESAEDDGLTVKLSAAWLIEKAGIPKGFALAGSNAAISSKHTLAITNRGGASAFEVLQLANFVQDRVRNQFGLNLVPEPNLVGF